MKKRGLILLVFFVFFGMLVNSQDKNIQKLYVGTYTSGGAEGIYICNFDSDNGEITLDKTLKGVNDPTFLKVSDDKRYMYVVSRAAPQDKNPGGYVSAYKIQNDGSLNFLNKQISNGADACHVDVSNNREYVAIATYGSGTTSLYPVKRDGSLETATSVIINKGSSINESRQTAPHAHSIKFSPFSNEVFSADLGTDQFNIFKLEGDKLVQWGQEFVKLEAGAGPRHFEFHQNGKIVYIINELNSTITVIRKEGDVWEKIQTISTLPTDFEGDSYCADIHISADGRFIYGSNRGHNSIVVFAVNPKSAELVFKGTVSTEGNWPRNFALSPDGKFMLVANQNSGNITVFEIDSVTGIPKFIGKEIKLPSPVCLEFL